MSANNCRKKYVFGSVMPFGEDSMHEFKGHRNLSVEEIPKRCFIPGTRKASRRAVSKALNGFLNTGKGGTVYLGVLDDGTVKGLVLSQQQINHVRVSLADLMNRYTPPVRKCQYTVEFVSVVTETSKLDNDLPMSQTGDDSAYSSDSEVSEKENRDLDVSSSDKKFKPHLLRTSIYCWCDKQALELCQQGVRVPEYVVEIKILPFSTTVPAHPYTLQLHPIYEDEEGKCYLRMIASLHLLTHQEIWDITRKKTTEHFESILQCLQERKLELLMKALVESPAVHK